MEVTTAQALGMEPLKGEIGIEIEMEGKNFPAIVNDKYWVATLDGSLRGENREFVLKVPISRGLVPKVVDYLGKMLEGAGTLQIFSFRTSTHVHINVQELTKKELSRFLYLAHLLEGPLVAFSGASRVGNRFCLRGQDAADQYQMLEAFIHSRQFAAIPHKGVSKYAAINLSAIGLYGSVEFRSMRGTVDPALLKSWVGILTRIKDIAVKFESLQAIGDFYQQRGALGLFCGVFTPTQRKTLLTPDVEASIQSAFSQMINIPYDPYKDEE